MPAPCIAVWAQSHVTEHRGGCEVRQQGHPTPSGEYAVAPGYTETPSERVLRTVISISVRGFCDWLPRAPLSLWAIDGGSPPTVDAGAWIILDAKINVLIDAKPKVASL